MRRLLLLSLVATTAAAGPVFTDLAPSTSPGGRRSTGLVIRGQGAAESLIIFGGFVQTATPPVPDVYFYTVAGNAWASVTSTSAARERHGLAIDPVRDRVVVFGGVNSGLLNTLTLIDGFTLAQSTPAAATGVPSTRADPLVEYLPPWGKFLVFGGRRSLIANSFVNDSYTLDLSDGGVTWAAISAAVAPSARGATCHAWDPVHGVVLLFGGEAANDLGDTWSFAPDGGGWRSLTVSGTPPSARSFAACAWDATINRFVLYGGQSANAQLGGLFTFDPATNTWTQETLAAPNPGPLSDSAAVYSASLGGVVLFGGQDSVGYSNKTWLLKFNAPPVVDAGASFSVNEGAMSALSGSVTDPDGDPTTFAWSQTLGPAVVLSSTSVANPSFTAPRVFSPSVLRFVLTGSDPTSSASSTVNVTVLNSINEAPTADAGPDQVVAGGATVTLSGSGSDPNNDPIVTSGWTQVAGPAVVLSSTSVPSPTFTAPLSPAGGDVAFTLVVNDGTLASPADEVVVTVLPGVGVIDAGMEDAGASVPDAGSADAGTPDAGAGDAGTQPADGGAEDGGLDAGSSSADGGTPDAGVEADAGVDAGGLGSDGGLDPDGGQSAGDAGSEVDAGAGRPPGQYTVGCGCDASPVPVAGLWLVAAWSLRRRARRAPSPCAAGRGAG